MIYSDKAAGDFRDLRSQNIREHWGYAPEKYLGQPDSGAAALRPDHSAAVEAESCDRSRNAKHGRVPILKKNGTYCWVDDAQQRIRDEKGQAAEVVGSWSDVTERKEAEIAFRRSEQRLTDGSKPSRRVSLHDADDRLIVCDRAYGELLYPGLGPLAGTTYETLVRHAAEEGLVEDAKGRVDASIAERLAKHRQPVSLMSSAVPAACGFKSTSETAEGGMVAIYTNIPDKTSRGASSQAKRKADLGNEFVSEQKREPRSSLRSCPSTSHPRSIRRSSPATQCQIASNRKKLTVFFSDMRIYRDYRRYGIRGIDRTAQLLPDRDVEDRSEHGATIDKYVGCDHGILR